MTKKVILNLTGTHNSGKSTLLRKLGSKPLKIPIYPEIADELSKRYGLKVATKENDELDAIIMENELERFGSVADADQRIVVVETGNIGNIGYALLRNPNLAQHYVQLIKNRLSYTELVGLHLTIDPQTLIKRLSKYYPSGFTGAEVQFFMNVQDSIMEAYRLCGVEPIILDGRLPADDLYKMAEISLRKRFYGPFYVLEGLNACGKSTVSRKLGEELGITVIESPPKELTEKIPRDQVNGRNPEERYLYYMQGNTMISDQLARSLQLSSGAICVRYVGSTLVGLSAIGNRPIEDVYKEKVDNLRGILVPDATFYLTASREELIRRMLGDTTRDQLKDTDLNQLVDPEFNERLRMGNDYLASRLNWVTISTDGIGPDQVAKIIQGYLISK